MGAETLRTVVAITTAIIGLAILAVLVSKNANTAGLITSYTGGLAKDIQAADGPITGNSGSSIGSFGDSFTGG